MATEQRNWIEKDSKGKKIYGPIVLGGEYLVRLNQHRECTIMSYDNPYEKILDKEKIFSALNGKTLTRDELENMEIVIGENQVEISLYEYESTETIPLEKKALKNWKEQR